MNEWKESRKEEEGKITGKREGRNQQLSEMMVAFSYNVPKGVHFLITEKLN